MGLILGPQCATYLLPKVWLLKTTKHLLSQLLWAGNGKWLSCPWSRVRHGVSVRMSAEAAPSEGLTGVGDRFPGWLLEQLLAGAAAAPGFATEEFGPCEGLRLPPEHVVGGEKTVFEDVGSKVMHSVRKK